MARRVRLVAALIVVLMTIGVSDAGAWSNGTDGCNAFGTHDWIAKKAIKAAAKEASWVRVQTALRATDDPDCNDGIDHASSTWWHVYDRWGREWGDAPEAVAVWFRRTKERLERGRRHAASRALGIMGHLVGDVAQPMHTDSSDREDRVLSLYEQAVDRLLPDHRFRYDGRARAGPATRTRKVAQQAHKSYRGLVRTYDRDGYNPRVHRITNRQLNLAANALADLIVSLR